MSVIGPRQEVSSEMSALIGGKRPVAFSLHPNLETATCKCVLVIGDGKNSIKKEVTVNLLRTVNLSKEKNKDAIILPGKTRSEQSAYIDKSVLINALAKGLAELFMANIPKQAKPETDAALSILGQKPVRTPTNPVQANTKIFQEIAKKSLEKANLTGGSLSVPSMHTYASAVARQAEKENQKTKVLAPAYTNSKRSSSPASSQHHAWRFPPRKYPCRQR